MSKTLKKAAIAVLLAASCVPLFSLSIDFGGGILNTTGFGNIPAGSPVALLQRDIASLWLQAALADGLTVNAQLGAMFAMDDNSSRPMFYYIDADLLNLEGIVKAEAGGSFLFRYSVGRIILSDFTGFILNHKADGLALGIEIPFLSADISAGYTGLVSKGASSIAVSRTDVNDVMDPAVYFAPPRLVETVRIGFPDLLGQKLTVSGVFQQDMRDTFLDLATAGTTDLISSGDDVSDPTRGGAVHSEYFGLGMDGTIVSTLTYSLYGYMGLLHDLVWNEDDSIYGDALGYSVLAGVRMGYYIESALYSRMGLRFVFASGDADATSVYESNTQDFTLFTPISRSSLGYVFSPQLSNIVRIEASYSLKPLSSLPGDLGRNLDARLKANVFLRPTPGAVSESGIEADNDELYLGTETDLSVNFRPFSDLGITLWGGLFIPGSAFGTDPALQYRAGLDVSLNF
jgi:hypothetical protein